MAELLKLLKESGPSALVGFVLGFVAIWWVEPLTPGGDLLVMLATIIITVIVGGIFRWLWKLAMGKSQTSEDAAAIKSSELVTDKDTDDNSG